MVACPGDSGDEDVHPAVRKAGSGKVTEFRNQESPVDHQIFNARAIEVFECDLIDIHQSVQVIVGVGVGKEQDLVVPYSGYGGQIDPGASYGRRTSQTSIKGRRMHHDVIFGEEG